MELVWDIYYAVLKDGSWIVDHYVYTERLFGTAMKKTDKTSILVLRLLKAIPSCLFSYFTVWPILLCSCTLYASISLALP